MTKLTNLGRRIADRFWRQREARKARRKKVAKKKRCRFNEQEKQFIRAMTNSKCHFCGKHLNKEKPKFDHVKPIDLGGASGIGNVLPVCRTCNSLRSSRTSEQIREAFALGIWAFTQISNETRIGREMGNAWAKELAKKRKRKRQRERERERQNANP